MEHWQLELKVWRCSTDNLSAPLCNMLQLDLSKFQQCLHKSPQGCWRFMIPAEIRWALLLSCHFLSDPVICRNFLHFLSWAQFSRSFTHWHELPNLTAEGNKKGTRMQDYPAEPAEFNFCSKVHLNMINMWWHMMSYDDSTVHRNGNMIGKELHRPQHICWPPHQIVPHQCHCNVQPHLEGSRIYTRCRFVTFDTSCCLSFFFIPCVLLCSQRLDT